MQQNVLKTACRLFRSSLFFILYSCGYHAGVGPAPIDTVSIPFISGDEYGSLTTELIRQLSSSGGLLYRNDGGHYLLKVKILSVNNNVIGFRRDRERTDESLKENLRPAEGRQTIVVEASLLESSTDNVLWGPKTVTTDVDYDYVDPDSLQDLSFIDSTGARRTVLNFSLGQLEPIDSAQEAALKPLYRKIARKVVDLVIFEWEGNERENI